MGSTATTATTADTVYGCYSCGGRSFGFANENILGPHLVGKRNITGAAVPLQPSNAAAANQSASNAADSLRGDWCVSGETCLQSTWGDAFAALTAAGWWAARGPTAATVPLVVVTSSDKGICAWNGDYSACCSQVSYDLATGAFRAMVAATAIGIDKNSSLWVTSRVDTLVYTAAVSVCGCTPSRVGACACN